MYTNCNILDKHMLQYITTNNTKYIQQLNNREQLHYTANN